MTYYTITMKSWFDPQNQDLTWKYQVKTTFYQKKQYVPMVIMHLLVVAVCHIDPKRIEFLRF